MAIRLDKKRGTYMVDIYITGKRTTRRGFKSRAEALIMEGILLGKRDEMAGKVPFMVVYNSFIRYYTDNHKPGAAKTIEERLSKHVVPYFERVDDINEIRPQDIEDWKNNMPDYSLNYRRGIFTSFSSLMIHAVNFFNGKRNPLDVVKNFSSSDAQEKNPIDYFTLEEFNEFNATLPEDRYKVLFNFLFWTGCRLGEALALNWEDFNSDFSKVHVRKSMTDKIKGRKYIITKVKTGNSLRHVTIPPQLQSMLRDLYNGSKRVP